MLEEDYYEQLRHCMKMETKASVRVGDRNSEWVGVHRAAHYYHDDKRSKKRVCDRGEVIHR